MEPQRHHPAPCAGWELVQHDWSVRQAEPEPRGLVAAVRRLLGAMLGSGSPADRPA